MNKTNLEMATAELSQALTNFKNMARAVEDQYLRFQAEEAYNDMLTWFNFFVVHERMQTAQLEKVILNQPA